MAKVKRAGKPAKGRARARPRSASPGAPLKRTPVAAISPEAQIVGAVLLGKVDNYLARLGVMTLVVEAPVAVGDTIRVKGHTTDLTQRVERIEVSHESVQSASAGEAVGLSVADRVRAGDVVYKV